MQLTPQACQEHHYTHSFRAVWLESGYAQSMARRNVPKWTDMLVRSSSKYLGFYVGPSAGANQWVGPAKKYADRVVSIRDMKLPLRPAVAKRSYYALPVPGYVAQLALPPPS